MEEKQQQMYEKLISVQEKLTEQGYEYWKIYSGLDSWQFWVILGMLVIPLIAIYLFIDRSRVFHIAFFAFATHALFAYIDTFGIRHGLWGYPYQLMPFLPSFSLDAAFIPTAVMFLYQWTLRQGRNYYIYSIGLAALFGFGFKPLLSFLGLFERHKWINYFHVFIIYVVLFLAAYGITRLFVSMQVDTPKVVHNARQIKKKLRWKLDPGRK